MFTSLDLLIIVFMALAAVTLLSLCLMFLIRNKTARKVFFYLASVLGLYVSWIGFRIGFGGLFQIQIVIGILTALMCVGAFVLERVSKGNDKMFMIARFISTAALVIGFFNAIF